MQELIQQLQELPDNDVLLGDSISEKYHHDWSADAPGIPGAVVRPSSTQALSETLKLCHASDQQVAVQGGLTGLTGGGIPKAGEIAINLERLNGIEELDVDAMTMTVKAGTPLQTIQEAADDAGFIFPLDLGARGTCNIGGNISTNAGGNQVLRFGMTRALVLGLEAVMADGTVITSMNKMLKNNAGYDLKHLFIGTEGTLGIVSRAVLRLFPKSASRCTALLALNNFKDVVTLLHKLTSEFSGMLSAYEVMWESYFHFITDNVDTIDSPYDTRYPIYVLTELEGGDPEKDADLFMNTLSAAMEDGLVADALIANSEKDREGFWKIRDGVGEISEFIRDTANFDISVPISSMQPFLEQVEKEVIAEVPNAKTLIWGHIADSNLHFICYTGSHDDVKAMYDIVYKVVGDFSGSVSAEHGIGVQKTGYLHHSRTSEEIALMQNLKGALDPKGILNSGRVIPKAL
ncbi:MAG: FAD-binding oxidoreductase [Gammaproteobacteria bacterium]|nr:FAD-binding oxidoreductase [Gammaproteobacteria bacterium]